MSEDAPAPNPTEVPMGYDNTRGMWLPGDHSVQVQVNPTISPRFENSPTISPSIDMSGNTVSGNTVTVEGGTAAAPEAAPVQIEVTEPAAEPAPVEPGAPEEAASTEPATPEPEPPEPEATEPAEAETEEENPLAAEVARLREQLAALERRMDELLDHLTRPEPAAAPAAPAEATTDIIEPATATTATAPEPPAGPEVLQGVEAELEASRRELLEIVIRRRARSTDRLSSMGKEDKDLYDAALDYYRTALANFLEAQRAAYVSTTPEGQQPDEEEIRKQLTLDMFNEQKKMIELEHEMNNALLDEMAAGGENAAGKLWAKRANLLRTWANYSTRKKILIGVGVGAVAAIGSSTLGLGIAGLAAGSAAKFSLGILNKKASARNVSEHSRDQELKNVDRAMSADGLLHLEGDPDPEVAAYDGALVDRIQSDLEGRIAFAQRRNKIGNVAMVLSGASIAYGVSELAGAPGLPHISELWGGGGGGNNTAAVHHSGSGNGNQLYDQPAAHSGANTPYTGGEHHAAAAAGSGGHSAPGGVESGGAAAATSPNTNIDMTHFRPGSFYGRTPQEAVGGMFKVIQHNNIDVHGLTPAKVNAIEEAMRNQHWDIAYGTNANGSQHLVDAAQGFGGHTTANAQASGLEGLQKINGSSVENWNRFMALARQNGVTFTQKG